MPQGLPVTPMPLFHVDAFADAPFRGNPAAVCLLPAPRDAAWMQSVAREMNLSETAFAVARGDEFDLRWFTPAVEVDLCGHATLATAHVLWEEARVGRDRDAVFHTRSGRLAATRRDDRIEMDFPARPPVEAPPPPGLADAIGAAPRWSGRGGEDWLVEVATEALVRSLRPDFDRLARVDARGVIVTAASDSGSAHDFVSRFFGPAVGVPEDPVTGSAHCVLGPFWAARTGRDVLRGFQASARGGTVEVRVRGARVALGGRAVTIARGRLAPRL